MEQKQDEYPIHVFASNQSMVMAVCDLEISIDGRTIFRREMTTGTQHNWEQVTEPIASGEHTLVISEVKTQTRKSKALNIDRELWIVVTFHGPPARLEIDVFDHPVGFM